MPNKPELPRISDVTEAASRAAENAPDAVKKAAGRAAEMAPKPVKRAAATAASLPRTLAGAADTLRRRTDELPDASVTVEPGVPRALREVAAKAGKRRKKDRHSRTKVAFFRYSYYDIAFKFFVEQVLDADYIALPEATRRTMELGSLNSNDFVCSPFKHLLGDYIEALELGADVLVQFSGPCRLGYYGELQESILRDMGYEFDMLNFATVAGKPMQEYLNICKDKVNPDLSIPQGVKNFLLLFKMIENLDSYNDRYLELAGFEREHGSFARAREDFYADMREVTNATELAAAYKRGMHTLEELPIDRPVDPIRVGLIGEYFTAVDPRSNLYLENKLSGMGVSLARYLNMTNRNLHYNEPNLRRSVAEYVDYDMGPTSTMTVAAAKRYAQEGFDGIIHLKSSGCTPEIDVMPVLQRISNDFHIPILYLSYDSQTSDTGLDTRLEAFYDMVAMRKAR